MMSVINNNNNYNCKKKEKKRKRKKESSEDFHIYSHAKKLHKTLADLALTF